MSNNNNFEQFKKDCKLINLKHEYEGYTGKERWAIVTELTEAEILEKYSEIIKPYMPFVRLSVLQGQVIEESNRNNHKHKMREVRSGNLFDINDDFEEHHPELSLPSPEDMLIAKEEMLLLYKSLSVLKDKNKERIIRYYFFDAKFKVLASESNISVSGISRSIEESFKKFYENHSTF